MTAGVYMIKNTSNDNFYVGSSKNLAGRWTSHLKSLRRGASPTVLQNAFNKYGVEAFRFIVIESITDLSILRQREQHHIDTLKPRYNMAKVATGGQSWTEDSLAKMRKSLTGKKKSPAHRANISAARKGIPGRKWSSEERNKNSLSHRGKSLSVTHKLNLQIAAAGKTRTQESRDRQSASRRGMKLSEEHKAKISAGARRMWSDPAMRRKTVDAIKTARRSRNVQGT